LDIAYQFSSIWEGASTKSRATLYQIQLPHDILKKAGHKPSTVEPGVLGLAKKTVEDVAHFVEEGNDIVVPHDGRLIRSGLG